jgi:6-phosphofructokinase 1
MGRQCGYLALMAALVGGAEAVMVPEFAKSPEDLADELRAAHGRGKQHAIVVVAEGAAYNATGLAQYFEEHRARLGFDLRVTILGHVQRGAAPNAYDRYLGSQFGAAAVEALARGERGVLVGLRRGQVTTTPLAEIAGVHKPLDAALYELAQVLAL